MKKKEKNEKVVTTIKINKITKSRLDRLKEHERETYEQVIRKILYILNISKKDPERATRMFRKLDTVIKRKDEYQKHQKLNDDE